MVLEIEKLCAAGPARLKEWGAIFVNEMGVEDSVMFLATHKGLGVDPPTEDAITTLLISMRSIITAAAYPGLTLLEDPNLSTGTPEEKRNRATARAAMTFLHTLAYGQKPHCVQKTLALSGLGDTNAREEAEARNKKEKAGALASEMRKETAARYHMSFDPRNAPKPEVYVRVREALKRDELAGLPDLCSSQLNGQVFATEAPLQLQVSENGDGAVMAPVDDLVPLSRNGLVLMQIEAVLQLMLVAGHFQIDASKYAALNGAGAINRDLSTEWHVAFGLDAMLPLQRRFTWISAYVSTSRALGKPRENARAFTQPAP